MRINFDNKKINIEQVIAVVLSFINLYFPFISFFIFVEYLDVLQKGTLSHFQFHTVGPDIVFMAFGVAVLISSITTIVKYFGNKKVKLIYPVVLFIFPIVLYFIIPYALYLLKRMN